MLARAVHPVHPVTRRLPAGPAAAALVCLAVLTASPAAATTVLRQSVGTLVERSALVVRGRVTGLQGHVPVGAGHPFRLGRVAVEEVLAGEPREVVWVRLPGGAGRDGRATLAAGVPDLATGDEVLLFLEPVPADVAARPVTAPGAAFAGGRGPASRATPAAGPAPAEQWIPVSLAVGSYRVDRGGGRPVVRQDAAAAGLRQVGDVDPGAAAPEVGALDELGALVRRLAGGGR